MSTVNIRNTKGIAKNTVFLYIRSIVVMAVGLFTSRVILQTLGVDDYGIYNVVGGFVSMFSIISAAMVNASQRFISFEMGKESPQLNRIFCGTVSIHLVLAAFVLILFETFGLWFLNTQLNIEADRMYAANWVFQCSVISFCINLICVPYNASIIAHEKMDVFAYISIYEVFAKLGIVYLLWITGFDKLIVYAILVLTIVISLRFIYGFYCSRHFDECKFHFVIDKPLFKELLGFTGWNFIGNAAGILATQGISILINLFFGVALNAARGIAEQVNQAINTFVNNFMTAMNPQITKSYAAGDIVYMNKLLAKGAKYASLLFWFLALTIFVEADEILDIWLVEVPPYAPIFLRLTIIFSIFQALSNTLYIAMLATGRIKKYQLVMGGLYFGSFVLCYLFFKVGLGPEFGYVSTLLVVFIALFVRLKLISEMIPDFSAREFLKEAVIKSVFVIVLSTIIAELCKHFIPIQNVYLEIILILLISLISVGLLTVVVALSKNERELLYAQIKKKLTKA